MKHKVLNNIAAKEYPKYVVTLMYAYLFCYYVRPQDNIPGMGIVPWVGVLFLIVTIYGFFNFKISLLKTPVGLIFWLGVMFGLVGIGAISPASFKLAIKWMFQTFPQCVMLYLVFKSGSQIKGLFHWWCVIYFFMAIITIKNAPRGPGDFTNDPNDAALALSMGLPFVFYAAQQLDLSKKLKYFYYLTVILILVGIIFTTSRGGFLGLLAAILVIWWLSKSRVKIALYSFLIAMTAGILVMGVLPSGYIDEVNSISDPNDETRIERFRTWEMGWIMFKDKPLVGIGAGNFMYTTANYQRKTSWWTRNEKSLVGRSAHSLYFQILPELGLIGIMFYAYAMIYAPLKLYVLRKKTTGVDEQDELVRLLSNSLIAAMAAYAVSGAFISVAYYPHIPIWITMYAIIIRYSNTNLDQSISTVTTSKV